MAGPDDPDHAIDYARAREPGRGRQAVRPGEIPPRGWWDIAVRIYRQLGRDNVGLVAAGIALYALLAVFPGIAALVSLYALVASPADIVRHVDSLAAILPPAALAVLTDQLTTLSVSTGGALEVGAVTGLLLALWSARRAMAAVMVGMNIAYGEAETRGIVRKATVSLLLTGFTLVAGIIVVGLGVVAPIALELVPLGRSADTVLGLLRWMVLWTFAVLMLAVVYRFAPDRNDARWRWVTWGSAAAATLWLAAGFLFTLYVVSFGRYTETYGALGGVVVLLLWFWLTAVVTLLGAEINAEIEHQTACDTTTGASRPLGHRGAHVADTVGIGTRSGAS